MKEGDAKLPCHSGEPSFTLLSFSFARALSLACQSLFWLLRTPEKKPKLCFVLYKKCLTEKMYFLSFKGAVSLMGRTLSKCQRITVQSVLSLPMTLYRLGSRISAALSMGKSASQFPSSSLCKHCGRSATWEYYYSLQQHSIPDLYCAVKWTLTSIYLKLIESERDATSITSVHRKAQ